MKTYELVALSVQINNKLYRKENKPAFTTGRYDEVLLESLYRVGFIKPKGTKANTPKEVVEQYYTEKQKQLAKEKGKKQEEAKKRSEEIAAAKAKEAEEAEAKAKSVAERAEAAAKAKEEAEAKAAKTDNK